MCGCLKVVQTTGLLGSVWQRGATGGGSLVGVGAERGCMERKKVGPIWYMVILLGVLLVLGVIFAGTISSSKYARILPMLGRRYLVDVPLLLGLSLVMLRGRIDLALGGNMSLGGIVFALVYLQQFSMGLAVLAGLFAVALFGLLAAVLTTYTKASSILLTLLIGLITSNIAYALSDGESVSVRMLGSMGGTAPVAVLLVVFVFIMMLREGRKKRREIVSGVKVDTQQAPAFLYYILSALLAGFAGIFVVMRAGAGYPGMGIDMSPSILVTAAVGGYFMANVGVKLYNGLIALAIYEVGNFLLIFYNVSSYKQSIIIYGVGLVLLGFSKWKTLFPAVAPEAGESIAAAADTDNGVDPEV